jgi:outer membrane protein, heavy metal efflux system
MRSVQLPSLVLSALLSFGGLPARARAQAARGEVGPSPRHPISPEDDAELGRSARLGTIVRIALDRNRDVAENRARTLAAEARGRAAARLPDLELKYEQWGVPLANPMALNRADTLMIGLRQSFPAWGTLDARGRAALEEVGSARSSERGRTQELAAQVRRTYATYYRADQEIRLHLEHVGLTSRVLQLARLGQRTGHGSLQDVLRLELELTRLHTDVARIEGEQRSSGALLNALMDRAVDAPLGPPEDLSVVPSADVAKLEKGLDTNRPEVDSAARAVRRTEATVEVARRAARFPSVMVGLDYWYMPMGTEVRHGYGAMVAINLPWLSGRRSDDQEEARQNLRAEQQALASTRNVVRYQLRDAAARFDSARQSFSIIDQELLAEARRSLEATQSAYAAGQGDAIGLLDALRSYLQVRIERVRALAELASSQADVERAAGTLAVEGRSQ